MKIRVENFAFHILVFFLPLSAYCSEHFCAGLLRELSFSMSVGESRIYGELTDQFGKSGEAFYEFETDLLDLFELHPQS